MANSQTDQAEGLRRLLVQDSTCIATITSGGARAGRTTTVINLAAALAGEGKNVLVIDENVGANNLAGMLAITAHRDLLDVIRHDKVLDEVILSTPAGFRILPAGRGLRVLETLSAQDRAHLVDSFACFTGPVDVVLIDAAPGRASRFLPLVFSSHEIVVVVSPDPSSITAAYGLIKYVKGDRTEVPNVHVLVNRARTEAEARLIFDNMESAARHYLGLPLDFTGFIPQDGKLSLGHAVAGKLETRSTGAFRRVAESLAQWPSLQTGVTGVTGVTGGKGMDSFVKCLLRSIQGSRPGFVSAESRQPSHV